MDKRPSAIMSILNHSLYGSDAKQYIKVNYYRMICSTCCQLFYESGSMSRCPHCNAEIEETNLGEDVTIKFELDTKTGEVNRYE